MSMTDEQVTLLREVLEHITAHPDEWDQSEWAVKTDCDTAYCVAGHVAVRSGYVPDWFGGSASGVRIEDGSWASIRDVATYQLGLDQAQALLLFDAGNSLRALWSIAGELCDGRIVAPDGVS